MQKISIGDELKDGYPRTKQWISTNLAFVQEMESFYRQRAAIEREYADKINRLTTDSFAKLSKQAPILSVGEKPTITPGSLECASVVAWREVLLQTENISKEKRAFASKLESSIATSLNQLNHKYSSIEDRWGKFNDELISIRDKNFSEMANKKKAYDAACEAMESHRAKAIKSPNNEKLQEKLTKRENEMNIAKNNYLISISISNRLKDKYFYQDTPEILDGLQDLNEAKVSKVNSIWLSSTQLERKSNDKINTFTTAIDNVVKQNLPMLDSAMFVKHNLANWSEPADFQYIPSQIWHDDQTMNVNEGTLLDLKIKLNNACAHYENYTRLCNDEKQNVEELLLERNKLVGDTFSEVQTKSPDDYAKFEEILTKSITPLQKFTNDDTRRVIAEVEIETIQAATQGRDMTITEPIHKEKKSKLGSLLKFKHQQSDIAQEEDVQILELSNDVNNISVGGANTKTRVFSSLGNFIDAYNTPAGGKNTTGNGSISGTTTTTTNATATAIALYAYSAKDDDELPMAVGDTFSIIEADDGSGWTRVSGVNGEGLVPTSYLKITQTTTVKKQGPKVAPRKNSRAVKRMQALYDYEAQGEDELNLYKGDTIIVIQEDDGSGWTEGELETGGSGLFPTSYATYV